MTDIAAETPVELQTPNGSRHFESNFRTAKDG
jgi:hypothetical protein